MVDTLLPASIDVPEAQLDDLRQRLRRTRWPERETVEDWSQGIPLGYVQDVCATWRDDYDWRRCETELNGYDQLRFVDVGPDGMPLGIQVMYAPSAEPAALALVMTHGWPGSVVEFLDIVERLRDPVADGGDAADAFHVVCPSLPGYGFSDRPAGHGWNVEAIADSWARLMTALGYDRFGAQGGDWGSAVTTRLGVQHPDRCLGIHLNMVSVGPSREATDALTDAEQSALASLAHYQQWESGYSTQQATRPQTVGYGLVDSPAAQAAWIIEKFWAWSDHDGHPEDVFGRHRLLDNVMHYWLPGTGASSARLYWESFRRVSRDLVNVPAGMSIFPKEIFRASRRWAERRFSDIRHWNELDRGGHFAAFERPDVFVDEVRTFFRTVR